MKIMKSYTLLILSVLAFASCGQEKEKEETSKEIVTTLDTLSYCIGANMGNMLQQTDLLEVDIDLVKAGMKDVLDSADLVVTQQEASEFITAYLQEKKAEQSLKQYGEVKEKGENFLEENKTKEDIKTLPSGLQYKVLKEGKGDTPNDGEIVKFHYKGTFIDGEVFDSSYEKGEPIEVGIQQLIPGWQEGLKLMKEGAKYKLFIPYDLAYGVEGKLPYIPPYSALIFEVELLEVK